MRAVLSIAVLLLIAPIALADDPAPPELILHPQTIESPVLKYRLYPAEVDRKAGNAAPILLRLPWEQNAWMTKVAPTLHEWSDRPLNAPEWQGAGSVLPQTFYNEMKRAAYRREANWEYPIGEQSAYSILLPDVQGLRTFLVHGLSVKIRYHLTQGELDQAREGILVGLANSQHIAETPFFVNQLVSMVIQRVMLERTSELISRPGSPNLYWPLSTLPGSLAGLDRAANFEASLFEMTLPAVNDLDRPRDAKEWRKMANQLVELLEQLQEIPPPAKPEQRGDADLLSEVLRRLGLAEEQRIAFAKTARTELGQLQNLPEARVVAMSDDEVGIRWYVHLRRDRDHLAAAALTLPPREAWPRLVELQAQTKAMREKTGGKGLGFLNPASIYVARWSVQRRIAGLRIVEAVRHYAATHDGKLPPALDDIEGLSIPLDPLTDHPFVWTIDGKVATLKAPPLPAEAAELGGDLEKSSAAEYRLKMSEK